MTHSDVGFAQRVRPLCWLLVTAPFAGLVLSVAPAADPKPAPLTYDEHVKPILREHCFKCHGDDQQKADLNLQSYTGVLKGGSGGPVVKAGRAGASVLFQAVAHEGEAAKMPPNRPKIPDAQIAVLRAWIDQGARESSSSSPAPARRTLEFTPAVDANPTGPPPMPDRLPAVGLPAPRRPHPVTALAASPRAPLVAVAGHDRILLHHTDTRTPLGMLVFPEGIPNVLRFSRDGAVLLAAGGRPVKSGKAVLFDVKSGKRLAEIGDETDAVLAADLSPDQQLVALGGTGKTVKVFATRDGKPAYKLTKHTDWITAVAFSPDGAKLATADRSGAVYLWEAKTGGILLALAGHKDSVLCLAWRGDSKVLASGSEDGQLILWDVQDGWPAKTLASPHTPRLTGQTYGKPAGGVLSVAFAADGRLVSCGRDGFVRVWTDGDAATPPLQSKALPGKVAVTHDGKTIIAGDVAGGLDYWPLSAKK